ncbi:acetyl-CoA carboxylase biotin carboxyl carrier protein subunit [Magnetospira sp. QH-2]|uniref:acetyl-CoA carboxylase biotin carboxyl carrier protein n=1 Tax=Magnetospira sp. (strain QH-2) TaxID=1288970 RepID=UPI0003E81821|nr:acetyl-CoA carboxylase biotin carboxyl carrier protein subunit [Magnetospira sp. QH-2]CCQ73224.1 Acetyl-CoA carboxylase, biotin carboxyl carrier protein subunit [Magnetospira sp. QH-2]
MSTKTQKPVIEAEMIRALAELLDETGLTEIEYGTESIQVRVARQVTAAATVAAPVAAAQASGAAPAAVADDPGDHPGALRSPMVGVVYTAPEPGAEAFIRVGDTVTEGQTILLIEAMKVFNPIPAPKSGKISRILVSSGAPVEFNEPLLIIE